MGAGAERAPGGVRHAGGDTMSNRRGARRWPAAAALIGVAGAAARRLFRLRVEGDEHVPTDGAAIIAANHLSFFDHIALKLSVGRRLTFLGKAEYLDSWKTRLLLPA